MPLAWEPSARQYDVVHKFGRNDAIGTSFALVSKSALYRTPQVGAATAVRIKAGGDAADTAAGAGAREVTVQGLDETGALVEEAIATAGASASTATTTTFIRIFRAWVSASGAYAVPPIVAVSHAAAITIENAAGTEDWLTIDYSGVPSGQSEIAQYTVPLGKVAYIKSLVGTTDASKITEAVLMAREGILKTAAPYDALRESWRSQTKDDGKLELNPDTPLGPFGELTDLIFMAKVDSTTASVEVDFEIILIDKASFVA